MYSDIADGKLHIYERHQFCHLLLVSEIVLGISPGFDNTGCTAAGAAVYPGPSHKIPTDNTGDL